MKILILALLTSFSVFSQLDQSGTSEKFAYEVIALNSPVKDGVAKFLLKSLVKTEVIQIKYLVQNPFKMEKNEKEYFEAVLVQKKGGVEFQLPVNHYPNGFYRMYLQVSTKEQKSIQFRNKYHDFVKFEINKPSKVQMPDPVQNNATVAGVDIDNNGIRDDIQLWINENYSNNELHKKSMEQTARAIQAAITNVSNLESAISAAYMYLESLSCMNAIFGLDGKSKNHNSLKVKMMNTKARLYAEVESNHHFSGQSFRLPKDIEEAKSRCAF